MKPEEVTPERLANDEALREPREVVRFLPIRRVLAIGASAEFAARCHDAGSMLGALVTHASVANARCVAHTLRPMAIVTTAAVYSFDAPAFDELAGALGAAMVVVDEAARGRDILAAISRAIRDLRRRERAGSL